MRSNEASPREEQKSQLLTQGMKQVYRCSVGAFHCVSVEGEGAVVCKLIAPFCEEAWMCVTPLVEEALLMVLTMVLSQVVLVSAAPHSWTRARTDLPGHSTRMDRSTWSLLLHAHGQICNHISATVLWVRGHSCLF